MRTDQERVEDLERRVSDLEKLLDEMTMRLRQAQSWDEVNVAGGIAHNELHGGS